MLVYDPEVYQSIFILVFENRQLQVWHESNFFQVNFVERSEIVVESIRLDVILIAVIHFQYEIYQEAHGKSHNENA